MTQVRTEQYVITNTHDGKRAQSEVFEQVAALIRSGEVVAFPTETVYGLGANALDERAVARIFKAKGRPSDNPLIVHVADQSQIALFAETPNELESKLMAAFWPGPLTLILQAKANLLPLNVTAGLATVAVRQPSHPVALALLQSCGVPLAAPSANRSGKPSPTSARHVHDDLNHLIAAIVDGGPTDLGIESTVVQCVNGAIHILRPGSITTDKLAASLPGIQIVAEHKIWQDDASDASVPRSPGVKYAHYSPDGEMTVVESRDSKALFLWAASQLAEAKSNGHRTGVLTYREHEHHFSADVVLTAGEASQPEILAHILYDALREFDRQKVTYIIAEACTEFGVGAAVMNRLLKAANNRLVRI